MTEEACRTRSQKRTLERDPAEDDAESKKIKMERGLLASDFNADGASRVTPEPGAGPAPALLRAPEVTVSGRGEGPAGDGPVDMRTSHSDVKSERRPPSPDVIVLSDNEQPASPRVNGLTKVALKETSTEALLKSSPEERERMIKQLQEELRLEEAKLVLLKKLRQSQTQKEAPAQKPVGSTGSAVTTPPPLVRGTQNIPAGKPSLQTSTRMPGSVIPPPLVRGGQQASSKLGPQASSQVVMPPLVRGAQQIHTIRQHSSSGPPPLLLAPRASVPSVQIQGQRIIQQGLIRVANVPNTSLLVNIPQPTPASLKGTSAASAQANSTPTSVASVVTSAESPASRQAAAKLALRKQLEKTLLEIPPPKPPAPEMNFLPSAANNEFIYLVGLEEVVQNLLETQAGRVPAAVAVSREPYMCAQCKTDFTCRWREEKGGAVMCESCMTSNQKKALKVEHTSRLKAAFVKALQQEQEMEQRLLQQGTSPAPAKAEPALKQVIKPRRKLAFRSGEARDWSNGAVLQPVCRLILDSREPAWVGRGQPEPGAADRAPCPPPAERAAAPLSTAGLQPAVPGLGRSSPRRPAHVQPVTEAAERGLRRGPGQQGRQTFRESRGHRQGQRPLQLEEVGPQHRRDPHVCEPGLGAQDVLGRGPPARVPPGHDPAALHPPVGHVEVVPGPVEGSSLLRPAGPLRSLRKTPGSPGEQAPAAPQRQDLDLDGSGAAASQADEAEPGLPGVLLPLPFICRHQQTSRLGGWFCPAGHGPRPRARPAAGRIPGFAFSRSQAPAPMAFLRGSP